MLFMFTVFLITKTNYKITIIMIYITTMHKGNASLYKLLLNHYNNSPRLDHRCADHRDYPDKQEEK